MWRFRLDNAPLAEPGFAAWPPTWVLSADEWARAARFRIDLPRRLFVASRIVLRLILGAYLKRDADKLVFMVGPHGKPVLPGDALQFNLSHSGTMGMLAVTPHRPVGCDVEVHGDRLDTEAIAANFFSTQEQAWLAAQSDQATRRAAFYAVWVRKEAFLKGMGMGLTMPLASFTVTEGFRLAPTLYDAYAVPWQMQGLVLPHGCSGALAVGGAGAVQVEQHDLAWATRP